MADKLSVMRGGRSLQAKRRSVTTAMTTATQVATLPRGSVILGFVLSGIASNAGTTATLSIGSSTTANEYVNAANVLAAGVGNGVNLLSGVAGAVGGSTAIPSQSDMPIYVKYAETGTASNAGGWKLWIVYTTGNEQGDETL